MQKPTILVTGANGKTGGATISQLLAKGYPVRALVQRADHRSELLAKRGAKVVVGSLEDITDLHTVVPKSEHHPHARHSSVASRERLLYRPLRANGAS